MSTPNEILEDQKRGLTTRLLRKQLDNEHLERENADPMAESVSRV
jgi:hypothetical protein